jgi:hypothetical protein
LVYLAPTIIFFSFFGSLIGSLGGSISIGSSSFLEFFFEFFLEPYESDPEEPDDSVFRLIASFSGLFGLFKG